MRQHSSVPVENRPGRGCVRRSCPLVARVQERRVRPGERGKGRPARQGVPRQLDDRDARGHHRERRWESRRFGDSAPASARALRGKLPARPGRDRHQERQPDERAHERSPAATQERKRQPGERQHAGEPAEADEGLDAEQGRQARGDERGRGARLRSGDRHAPPGEKQDEEDDEHDACDAQSLSHGGEGDVLGQPRNRLGAPAAEPHAAHAAGAKRELAALELEVVGRDSPGAPSGGLLPQRAHGGREAGPKPGGSLVRSRRRPEAAEVRPEPLRFEQEKRLDGVGARDERFRLARPSVQRVETPA